MTFSNIPAHTVMPLGDVTVEEIRRAAFRSEQGLHEVDLANAHTKAEVMEAVGKAFEFGDHFGKNLDALFDSLTDMTAPKADGAQGLVLVLLNIPNKTGFDEENRQDLLDVFRDASEHFFDKEIAFRVFYSVQAKSAVKKAPK